MKQNKWKRTGKKPKKIICESLNEQERDIPFLIKTFLKWCSKGTNVLSVQFYLFFLILKLRSGGTKGFKEI